MRITITVKPGAKMERITKISDGHYTVAVRSPAREGKANHAAIQALANYFGIAPSLVTILSGHTGRIKIVKIRV